MWLVDSPESRPRASNQQTAVQGRFSRRPQLHEQKTPPGVIPAHFPSGKERIMHDYGGWMWFLIDIVLVAVLAAALIYGIGMWHRRPRDGATQQVRDEATDRLYHERH